VTDETLARLLEEVNARSVHITSLELDLIAKKQALQTAEAKKQEISLLNDIARATQQRDGVKSN
jgi:hypothetical protein